ncbi:MAG: PEP-CTERM sorting domain-containing protein [Sedimentisphaerales bacterium]|nr:PEP-CTERM sorting domain-containing protein [Sedimentisphaerales bacterium]
MACRSVKIRLVAAVCLLMAILSTEQLCAVTIPFERISNNAPSDIAGQLSAIVSSVDANHIKFEFHNSAIIASSIIDIYFDDGGPNPPGFLDSLSSIIDYGTLFGIGAEPANLPAGNNLTPDFSADFAVQSQNAPPTMITNGVDNLTDYVGLVFLLKPSITFDDVTDALDNQSLRLGLHVQAIGTESDSFVSVPEPATICLLGLGILSLIPRKK